MAGNAAVEEAEWSFLTFCRIRPPSLHSLSLPEKDQHNIQYRVSDGGEEESGDKSKKSCKIVALEIPAGADPGLVHNNPSGFVSFSFNEVFDIDATQEDVFMKIQPMVMDIFEGMNSTVLAYGQTGSGKTYSICGGNTFGERGLIPRSIGLVFEELAIRREDSDADIRYKVLVSFTEVFGEHLYDLLDPQKRHLPLEEWQKIQVLEGEDGLVLRNINVFEVANEEEVLNLFFMGSTNRTISSTKMNDASSRSHAIFTMVVETEETIGTRKTFSAGKINLVDLAGSERLYKVNNSRSSIKEGKSINLSLHYLEQVIISLRDSIRNPVPQVRSGRRSSVTTRGSLVGAVGLGGGSHIPYRNSVLTNILRDSLGGNCKSCFLLTMAAEVASFEESVSTGRFGQRCGEIQVKVHANLEVDVHSQLREARQRVHQLQQRVLRLEEEQRSLQNTIQTRDTQLQDAINVDRVLSVQEEHDCDSAVQSLCEAPLSAGNSLPSEGASDELRGLSRAALVSVIHTMSQHISDLRQQNNNGDSVVGGSSACSRIGDKEDVPVTIDMSRARALLENSTSVWSLNGVEDEDQMDETKSERSENSYGVSLATSQRPYSQSDEVSLTDNTRPVGAKSAVTQSKRVRQLLDGITVVTTGAWGNSKTKLLSLSTDFKQLMWLDITNNTTKKEDISTYKGFVISDLKPDGVVVKYEHRSKSKKMEIPRNNLPPEEIRSRVLKWIGVLNSLRETSA